MQAVQLDLVCRHLPPPARHRCGAGRGNCLLHLTQDPSGRRPAGGFGAQLGGASRLGGISFEGVDQGTTAWAGDRVAPGTGSQPGMQHRLAIPYCEPAALILQLGPAAPWQAGPTRYFELWRPAALCSTLPTSSTSVDP